MKEQLIRLFGGGSDEGLSRPRHQGRNSDAFLLLTMATLVALMSHFIIGRLGVQIFIGFLAVLFVGSVYFFLSWRDLFLPFLILVLSVGGFRFLWLLKMPGLPDFYLDRMALTWALILFSVKSVAERRPLAGPFLLDVLLTINAFYLLVTIILHDYEFFNLWTKSYFVPLAAYFLAKNVVVRESQIRRYLVILAILNIYYALTSVAEKFDIHALVWPKWIITQPTGWPLRSNGPFAHAPLFGTVIGMILPVYLYLLATSRRAMAKAFWAFSFLLALAGLYFTYTRGSWLAGAGALFVAVLLNRRQYLRIILPVLILAPLLAIVVLGAGNDSVMKKRAGNEETVTSRIGVAITALRMWRDHPIFGVGFFQYRNERHLYVDPVDAPFFGTVRFTQFRHTSLHDIYWGPMSESGLFGTLLQLLIYFIVFRSFYRQYRNKERSDHYRYFQIPVLAGMCVGYQLGGIAIDYRFFSTVGTLYLAAAAMAYGFGEREEREQPVLRGPKR